MKHLLGLQGLQNRIWRHYRAWLRTVCHSQVLGRGCVLHAIILPVLHDRAEVLRTPGRRHIAIFPLFDSHLFRRALFQARLSTLFSLDSLLNDGQGRVLRHSQRLVVVVGVRSARPVIMVHATRIRPLNVYIDIASGTLDELLRRGHG